MSAVIRAKTWVQARLQGRAQWTSAIIAIALLVVALSYVLASIPSISPAIAEQMNKDSIYKTGTVVETVSEQCDQDDDSTPISATDVPTSWNCVQTYVNIPDVGVQKVQAPYGVTMDDLHAGTRVVVANYDHGQGSWSFFSVNRTPVIIVALALCVIIIILVTGAKGMRALLGIGLSLAAIVFYLIPSMLSGHSAIATTLSISILMLGLIMYLTHGVKWMTTTAFLGTSAGIGVIVLIGWLFDLGAKSNTALPMDMLEVMRFLPQNEVNVLRALSNFYFASLILASVGILNDVMIAQASTVWQLRLADKGASVKSVFMKAMSVGQDHVSSAMYTLVFVYASTALPLILGAYMYTHMSVMGVLSSDFGVEILKTGVCIIGLMVSVPLTTLFASIMSSHVNSGSLEKGAAAHKH